MIKSFFLNFLNLNLTILCSKFEHAKWTKICLVLVEKIFYKIMLIYGLNDKKKTFCKKNFVEKFCVFIFKFIFLPCEKANL